MSGLRGMLGSVRRDGGRSNKGNHSAGSSQSPMMTPKETDGSVRSSEKLAEEYRGIIDRHPRSAYTYRHVEDSGVPKGEDIETCTTWSRFLPRQGTLAQGGDGEASRCERKEGQINPDKMVLGRDEAIRVIELIQGRPKDETPLDPVRAEELRKDCQG